MSIKNKNIISILCVATISIVPLITSCTSNDTNDTNPKPTINNNLQKVFNYFQKDLIDENNLNEDIFSLFLEDNRQQILNKINFILEISNVNSISFINNQIKIYLSENNDLNFLDYENIEYDKVNNVISISNLKFWNNIDINLENLYDDIERKIINVNKKTISDLEIYFIDSNNFESIKSILFNSLKISNSSFNIDNIEKFEFSNNLFKITLKSIDRTKYIFDNLNPIANVSLNNNIISVSNLKLWNLIEFNNLESIFENINNNIIDKNKQTSEEFISYLKTNKENLKNDIFILLNKQNNSFLLKDIIDIEFVNNDLLIELSVDKIKYQANNTNNVIFDSNIIKISNFEFWREIQLPNLNSVYNTLQNDVITANNLSEEDFLNYLDNQNNLNSLKTYIVQSLNNKINIDDITKITYQNKELRINLNNNKIKYLVSNDNQQNNVSFSNNEIIISNLLFTNVINLNNISSLYDLSKKLILNYQIIDSNSFNKNKSEIQKQIFEKLNSFNSSFIQSYISDVSFVNNDSIYITLTNVNNLKYLAKNSNNVIFENNIIKILNLRPYISDPESWYIWNNNQIIGLSTEGQNQTRLIIPPKATSITNDALINARRKLKIVDMSFSNITRIEDSEYSDNPFVDLPEVDIGRINDHYKSGLFSKFSQLEEIKLPKNLSYLGKGTFFACSFLNKINLEDTKITSLTDDTFLGCARLNSIQIPNGVTSIGNKVFYGCRSIQQVELPDSITTIGESSFESCYLLESITIPNSVTTIGERSFFDCSELKTVNLSNQLKEISPNLFEYCYNITSIQIPDSVTSIGEFAFSGCKALSTIKLSNSLKTIGNFAFWNCTSITEFNFTNSITSIGDSVFSDCTNLATINLSNSLETIGQLCFKNCSSLTQIEIPNSIISIGVEAFYDCKKLTIRVPNQEKKDLIINNTTGFNKDKMGLVTSVCLIRKDTHFLCIDQNMKSSLILFAKLKKLQIK